VCNYVHGVAVEGGVRVEGCLLFAIACLVSRLGFVGHVFAIVCMVSW